MRSGLLALIFITASCGRVENPVNGKIGELRSMEPVVIAERELESLRSVCQAIAQKSPEALLNTQVQFKYSRKDCADKEISEVSTVTTSIQNTGAGYKFIQSGGTFFYFSDIETRESGSLSKICEAAVSDNVQSPLVTGNELLYFASNVSSTDCPVKTNEICVSLQRATRTPGTGQAKIHTKEWVRINLDSTQGRLGFFTLKRQVSSAGCAENQEVAHSAELK